MNSLSRPRIIWIAIVVPAALGILTFVFLNGGQSGDSRGVRLADLRSPEPTIPVLSPTAAREDFSGLPPRERINAETKRRVEEAGAWREKLRNGDQTTLPPEAYPPGVPLHSVSAPQ